MRYNHSAAYVARVMAVAKSLRNADLFTTVDTTTTTTPMVPDPPAHQTPSGPSKPSTSATSHPSPSGGPTSHPTSGPSGGPTSSPTSGPSGGPTSSPTSSPTGDPTSSPTGDPTGSPTSTPTDEPVIPDPVPDALADLTPAQIQAIDDGWLECVGTLPDDWTFDQMQTCLADQLDVPVDDGTLATFLQWAVDQGLVPAREEPTSGP
jgi:hypothetical protein